jgi:hypothetical protein
MREGGGQHNAGGTTSKKRGGGAILYPILHLSQYHVTGGHTGNQANKQNILGKTLQGVESYLKLHFIILKIGVMLTLTLLFPYHGVPFLEGH